MDVTILSLTLRYRYLLYLYNINPKSIFKSFKTSIINYFDSRFQYTPKYPEEIPVIEIENPDNIDEDVEAELKEYLLTQANENLGEFFFFFLNLNISNYYRNMKITN